MPEPVDQMSNNDYKGWWRTQVNHKVFKIPRKKLDPHQPHQPGEVIWDPSKKCQPQQQEEPSQPNQPDLF